MGTAGTVIAVGNLKGGTGKSTITVNLACAMAVRGLRTVVLDTDPQQTAMGWTRRRRLPCAVQLLPIRDFSGVGDWLGELIIARQAYERVLIDLPAVLSPALAAAFMAADVILIPTTLSPIDLEATRRTLRHARAAIAERPQRPPRLLVVPTLLRKPMLLGRSRQPGELLQLDVPIGPPQHYDPALAEAFAVSDWIGGHAPRSVGCRDLITLEVTLESLLATAAAETARREEAGAGSSWRDFAGSVRRAFLGVH
jgi:chromosome partitioning protein